MYIWNKAIYCTPLQSNIQGEQVILLEITSVTKQLYRWAVRPGSENILGPTYLPIMGAFLCEWYYQKPSSHDGLYIVRTWSRSGFQVCLLCATCVSVYCSLLVTNTDRLQFIDFLWTELLTHADVCISIQHSSRLFVLKATQNPLCKDTTGTDRSCCNHLTDTVT